MMVPRRDTARTSYLLHRRAMRVAQLAVAVAILILVALVAGATAHAATEGLGGATVDIREQATVSSSTICLEQVAEITASDEATHTLAGIEIGPSPLAGHERTITAGYIRMRIARAGFGRDEFALGGAAEITVRREGAAGVTPRASSPAAAEPAARVTESPSAQPPPPAPVIAKRGATVKITVVSGCVTVTTNGQLAADAAVGEYATARVRTTGRQVLGQLLGPNEMVVWL